MKFDISDIYTVVLKNETDPFRYHCPARQWDGFVLFTSGNGDFMQEESVYPLQSGSLVLLRRGDCYRFSFSAPCSYITAALDLVSCSEMDRLPTVVSSGGENIHHILRAASCWARHAGDSFMRAKVSLLSLYTNLMAESGAESGQKEHPAVREARNYLHENYTRHFSTAKIADRCHISPSELRLLFARATGTTMTAYRDDLRMQQAKELLCYSDFTMKEIADMLGYCDVYHFSKVFRRLCGTSPGAYTKRAKK